MAGSNDVQSHLSNFNVITISTLVISIFSVIIFFTSKNSNNGNDSRDTTPKPKKKKSSKSKKKSLLKHNDEIESHSETNIKLNEKSIDVDENSSEIAEFSKAEKSPKDSISVTVDKKVSQKIKKAKDTSKQKTTRIEREKPVTVILGDIVEDKDPQTLELNTSNGDVADNTESVEPSPSPSSGSQTLESNTIGSADLDGWAVVEKKRKEKLSDAEMISMNNKRDPVEVVDNENKEKVNQLPSNSVDDVIEEVLPNLEADQISTDVVVEARKIGLLIGVKGVTKLGIQNLTGAEINIPKVRSEASKLVSVSVTGKASSVQEATTAIDELCTKGYAKILAGPNFLDGNLTVNSKFLADIIGKGGANIKAIQSAANVRISTPSNAKFGSMKVKIGIYGEKDQVLIARMAILDICKYFYSSLSHPGITHVEMNVVPSYFNYIIGTKGSEIKNIQNTYNVNVYIPNEESYCRSVLLVGEESNLRAAEKHIEKIIERINSIAAEKAETEAAALAKYGINPKVEEQMKRTAEMEKAKILSAVESLGRLSMVDQFVWEEEFST